MPFLEKIYMIIIHVSNKWTCVHLLFSIVPLHTYQIVWCRNNFPVLVFSSMHHVHYEITRFSTVFHSQQESCRNKKSNIEASTVSGRCLWLHVKPLVFGLFCAHHIGEFCRSCSWRTRHIFFRVGLVFAEVEHYPNKAHQAADVRWRSSRLGGEVPEVSMWANDDVRWELDARRGQNYHTASWQSSRIRMGWKLPGRSWPVLFVQCLGTSPTCPSTFFGTQKIMNF